MRAGVAHKPFHRRVPTRAYMARMTSLMLMAEHERRVNESDDGGWEARSDSRVQGVVCRAATDIRLDCGDSGPYSALKQKGQNMKTRRSIARRILRGCVTAVVALGLLAAPAAGHQPQDAGIPGGRHASRTSVRWRFKLQSALGQFTDDVSLGRPDR